MDAIKPDTFIYISATDCPMCSLFDKKWPEVKEEIIKQYPDLNIMEILGLTRIKRLLLNPEDHPVALSASVGWFPSFVLVNKNNYEDVKNNPIINLHTWVYNAEKKEPLGRLKPLEKKQPLTINNILLWIENSI